MGDSSPAAQALNDSIFSVRHRYPGGTNRGIPARSARMTCRSGGAAQGAAQGAVVDARFLKMTASHTQKSRPVVKKTPLGGKIFAQSAANYMMGSMPSAG